MELISSSVVLVRYMRNLVASELPLMNLSLPEYGFYDRMPVISLRMFDEIAQGKGMVLCHMFTHEELDDVDFLNTRIIDAHNRKLRIGESTMQMFIRSHRYKYKQLIIQDILRVFRITTQDIIDMFIINQRKQFSIMSILLYKHDYDYIREQVLTNIKGFSMISALFDNEPIDVEELFAYIIETHFDITSYLTKEDLLEYIRQ